MEFFILICSSESAGGDIALLTSKKFSAEQPVNMVKIAVKINIILKFFFNLQNPLFKGIQNLHCTFL